MSTDECKETKAHLLHLFVKRIGRRFVRLDPKTKAPRDHECPQLFFASLFTITSQARLGEPQTQSTLRVRVSIRTLFQCYSANIARSLAEWKINVNICGRGNSEGGFGVVYPRFLAGGPTRFVAWAQFARGNPCILTILSDTMDLSS